MKKNRIISLILALVLVFSLLSTAAFAMDVKEFTDLDEDAWYYEYVERIVADEYFIGIGNNLFDPTGLMTRAMFVTVLHRVAGCPEPEAQEIVFPDVEDGTWYTDAVVWATENEIVLGYDTGLFGTTDNITREQMCVLMIRFINWFCASNGVIHVADAEPIEFTDADTISDWAAEDVASCVAFGLINGIPVSETEVAFKPLQNSSRAEVAKVIACLDWMLALNPNDLIGIAFRNSLLQINDKYIGRAQTAIDYVEDYTGLGVSDYIYADLFDFNTEIDENGARPQALNMRAAFDSEVVTKIVSYVVEYAYALAGPEVSLPTKAEIAEVVRAVKAEVEPYIPEFELSDLTVSAIVDYVYGKIKAAGGSIWANFVTEEGYVTGDVTVSIGDFSAVVNVDEGAGVSMNNKLAALKGFAIALAKELYASINEEAAGKWVSEFESISATVTFTFSPSAVASIADKTAAFPYVYPVTANLALSNDTDVLQYRYDNGPQFKLNVSEKAQAKYEAAVEAVLAKVLASDALLAKVEEALAPTLDSAKASAEFVALANVLDTTGFARDGEATVSSALNSWKNANLYKDGTIVGSPSYAMFWEKAEGADWNNTALYGVVTLVANSTASYVEDMIEAKAAEMAEDKGDFVTSIIEAVFDALRENITPAEIEALLNGESIGIEGLDDYDIAIGSDVDLNSVPAGVKDYVIAIICDGLRDQTVFATDPVIAAMKADIDAVIDSTVSGNATIDKMTAILDKANFFADVDELVNVQVRNFATLVRYADAADNYVDVDRYVAKICRQISKLPADASITINGVVFEEYAPLVQNVKDSKTLDEACEALAQLIEQPGIGDLCISSFADGVTFTAAYGARSYSVTLFIDVQ